MGESRENRCRDANNDKGLQTEICNPLIMLARPAGFEPTTPWFVAKYSIQLSYGRWKDKKYSKISAFCKKGSDHPFAETI